MPKPWDQEHIAALIEMLQELLEAADKEAVAVCTVLLPKLQERSGLDGFAFRSAVSGALHHRSAGPLH